MNLRQAQKHLVDWFRMHKRDLPWRADKNPYRIWVSETMLQQTTTTAVIPFFLRFMEHFPTLKSLAAAPETDIMAAWAGLGYYSRARNLHKAAKILAEKKTFPDTYSELIELPGFGPYTSRSVASLAFGESVGVVDGNVIRVLSRFYDQDWEWWKPGARQEIQTLADSWTNGALSSEINQGLMELGRTICTPRSPSCPLCPLRTHCQALGHNTVAQRPRLRPRRKKEIWLWEPHVHVHKGRLRLVRNHTLPFLQGQWLLPGRGRALKKPPESFDFRHSITHYDIFVTLGAKATKIKTIESRWVLLEEIRQHVPTSLVLKALRPPRRDNRRGLRKSPPRGQI